MANMSEEPDAFAVEVEKVIKLLGPNYSIEWVGPLELMVRGRRHNLENLRRMVSHQPERGSEIIEHYLCSLFDFDFDFQLMSLSRDYLLPWMKPRIQPESIFESLDRNHVPHIPFVNGTVVIFVIDMPHMTVSISTEMQCRWDLSLEALDKIARQNLDKSPLEVELVQSGEGGKAAIVAQYDGFDAARLLSDLLYDQLSPLLGKDFYVGIPGRDLFMAFSRHPEPFVRRVTDRVENDFRRLPYPISPKLFLVTRDGIAGTENGTEEIS